MVAARARRGRGRGQVSFAALEVPGISHCIKYNYCMPSGCNPDVAAYIGRWRPSSVSPPAAAFARDVITKTAPAGRERAKNLLWSAGKLADYAIGLGLQAVPEVV